MSPFFSIGVTTGSPKGVRIDMLRECLDSILGQTFGDFEIIVGNDFVEHRLSMEELGIHDSRITVINNTENLGEIDNMNMLLNTSRGFYFTWLADDDVYFPRYLEIMHRAVTEYGSLKVAFCGFMQGKQPPLDIPPVEDSIQTYSGPDWLQGYLSKTFPAVGCYGVFEREFMRSLGGTQKLGSSSFSPYCDNLLAVQASLKNKVAYCPDPLMFYRLHNESISYVSTDYGVYFTAQRDFLNLAENVFHQPAHSSRRGTYRALLLDWFIRDYFTVMRRGGTRSLSAIAHYCLFILKNLRATDNKTRILANLKSNIFSLYPRLLPFEGVFLKSLSRCKRALLKVFSRNPG